MAEYVTSGTTERAVLGINAVLRNAERTAECLTPHPADAAFWRSLHFRLESIHPIDLHHLFLAFSSDT